jgi:tripartite-type tricarboxylate transporter receptor subunit TctC
MKMLRDLSPPFCRGAMILLGLLLLGLPCQVYSQQFPTKPITIYCGYDAGGGTDISARALVGEAEKLLGVPAVVENKPGGGSTVCAALVASKNPDGYTLGIASSRVMTSSPHLLTLPYHSVKDFVPIMQYHTYTSGLLVLQDSPFKDIKDLIEYAKQPAGVPYGTAGAYTASHLSMVLFEKCKGLQLKHVPFKGGTSANTALLGKHVNFITTGDRGAPYVKQGVMRLLLIFNRETRDPQYPDIPILGELGCRDIPGHRIIVFGPKGLPNAVANKLGEVFKKAAESPKFQETLKSLDFAYTFNDRSTLEQELPKEFEIFKNLYDELGVKKGS